jgi:hypothetical protein
MKRILVAVLAVFVVWQLLGFVLHGLILAQAYQETASLWRPTNEMKQGVLWLSGLVAAAAFVCIYAGLVHQRSVSTGLKYGMLFGVGAGASMGFGTYSVMPITFFLAVAWFLGTLVNGALGGLLVGWLVKGPAPVAADVSRR